MEMESQEPTTDRVTFYTWGCNAIYRDFTLDNLGFSRLSYATRDI